MDVRPIAVRWDGGERQFHPGDHVLIGRGPDCDVLLTSPYVGRRHASLHVEDGAWVLTDLNSRRGVHVNGTRIARVRLGGPLHALLGDLEGGQHLEIVPVSAPKPIGAVVAHGQGSAVGTAAPVPPMSGPAGGRRVAVYGVGALLVLVGLLVLAGLIRPAEGPDEPGVSHEEAEAWCQSHLAAPELQGDVVSDALANYTYQGHRIVCTVWLRSTGEHYPVVNGEPSIAEPSTAARQLAARVRNDETREFLEDFANEYEEGIARLIGRITAPG